MRIGPGRYKLLYPWNNKWAAVRDGSAACANPLGRVAYNAFSVRRPPFQAGGVFIVERRIIMNQARYSPELVRDVARRRTFAIISHPDAGKTTLTEKLLLYGGAIQMAGTVKARKSSRHATSDWMEVEKQRGI